MPTVLQLTDTHLLANPAERLKGVPTRRTLESTLSHIRASDVGIDAVVITGDLAHDDPAAYPHLRELLGEFADRCFVIPGNHDDRAAMRATFGEPADADGETITFFHSIDDWQLIGLDTLAPGDVCGRIDAVQLEWLRSELERHADRPVGLFLHHPPATVGTAWLDRIGLLEPDALLAVIATFGNVRFISAGHVHMEYAGRIGEAAFFTTPSTGVQFNPHSDEAEYEASPPGYRLFHLEVEGFTSRVVRLPSVEFPPVDR